MYKMHQNGKFRMRASFTVTPKQIQGLNVICERTGLSFADVCAKALDITLAKYVQEGDFNFPDQTPSIQQNSATA